MDNSLIWLMFFLLISIIALLLIPRRQLYVLLPFSFVTGFIMTLTLLLLNVPLLRLWAFDGIPASSLLGIPLSLPLAFIPVMMLFAYYIPEADSKNLLIVWITVFSVLTTVIQGLSISAGIMRYIRWDLLATLLLTFSGYSLIALFILKYGALAQQGKLDQ